MWFGWVVSVFHQPQPVSGDDISIFRWSSLSVVVDGWVACVVFGWW